MSFLDGLQSPHKAAKIFHAIHMLQKQMGQLLHSAVDSRVVGLMGTTCENLTEGFQVASRPADNGRILELFIECPNDSVAADMATALGRGYPYLVPGSLLANGRHIWCHVSSGYGELVFAYEAMAQLLATSRAFAAHIPS